MLAIGAPAPDLTAKTHEGEKFTLGALRGKKRVVLWFFPQAESAACTIEARAFKAAKASFDANDTVIVGISCDGYSANASFAARNELPYSLISDGDRAIATAYGACAGPADARARRVTFVVGKAGTIEQVYPDVQPKYHVDDVLADLARRAA